MKTTTSFPEVPVDKLRWRCCEGTIPVATTDEAKPCEEIIGQERALKAIRTGLAIKSRGYNIFITGMAGTGRTTTVKHLLETLDKEGPTPDDILYVNNFRNPDEPVLLKLPAGQGKLFAEAMNRLIEMLVKHVPELLKSKFYSERRDAIVEGQQKKQKEILEKFEEDVSSKGFSVIQVQMGLFTRPDLIPVIEGQPTPFQKLEGLVKEKKLPKKTLDDLKARYEELTAELESVFERIREIDEETRALLKAWDTEAITPIIKGGIEGIRGKFPFPQVNAYLDEAEENLGRELDAFKESRGKDEKEGLPAQLAGAAAAVAAEAGDPFSSYRVNLLVDNSGQQGPPVLMETNPNYVNLFGSIDYTATRFGIVKADFTNIKAGSFLKANGGYLVLVALDALVEPGVWVTLKRSLRNRVLEIQNFMQMYLFSTPRLKPQPIPLDIKVVMIGDANIYNLLYFMDEDFKKIFKVKAEFDSEIQKKPEVMTEYVRFVKKIVDEDQLPPFDREGIAAVMEYSTRIAGRQRKLSTRFNAIADVIRESAYWARQAKKAVVGREDVETAVRERFERVSLIEDKIQEMIEEGSIMIDTQGSAVGQVNGLSVYDMGQFMFGKPTRITARTGLGRPGIIDIERESELSGPTHKKGVLILGGYLRGKYCQDKPFALSASIAFEQSYSGVEGDSASSTEVYAILSSIAGLPLRQDVAVTGSLNQKGDIQPIGGVNEKIEGFFDVCRAKGLTGTQGVIVPHQNVENLMLREDVVKAVADRMFRIWPVRSIDDGIAILTGIEAGVMREDGTYEEGTVNAAVDKALRKFADMTRSFNEPARTEVRERVETTVPPSPPSPPPIGPPAKPEE